MRAYSNRYKKKPEIRHKIRARVNLQAAVRRGDLVRKPCEKCGNPKSHGHHENYFKPLEVRWLCVTCHAKEHTNQQPKN